MTPDEPKRILVVDDDPVSMRLVMRILQTNGYDVRGTNDPKVAMDYARLLKPSLVILDFDMPALPGTDVAVLLKSSPETRNAPIVFLSGKTDAEHHEVARFTGAVRYLHKPVDPDQVVRTVQALLSGD